MKKLLGISLILLLSFFAGYSQQDNSSDDVYYNDDNNVQQPANQPAEEQNYDDNGNSEGEPTYQTFYDQLTPFGTWVNYPGYGYCWVPAGLGPDFSPYTTNGYWVYTDMGWTWVSDFAWGWGPFHYGRWFEDPYYGWMWVPGYDWAPAWVVWGEYGGYYGWACLGPRDILSPHFRPRADHWHFIEHQYIGRADASSHIVNNEVVAHNTDINSHINIIGHANTYRQSVFFSGPKPAEVEHYTGQKIEPVKINNSKDPARTRVNNNTINIYRPNIVRNNEQHVAPAKVDKVQDLKQRPNNEPRQNIEQRTVPVTPEREKPQQQWTPPRQSPQVPQRQNNAPTAPQRNYVPSERPAQQPVQRYSPPPQQHYNAPPQQRSSPPVQPHNNAPAPRSGGIRR